MTEDFFRLQVERLKSHFGAKAFSYEFIRILGLEVAPIGDEFFRRTVDTWIGNRRNNNPPLLVDFREARIAFEKSRFQAEVSRASDTFHHGLKEVLRKQYNVDSLAEAIELERLKLKLLDTDLEHVKAKLRGDSDKGGAE